MFIKIYLTTLSIFLAIDMVWLGLVAKSFYSSQIGFLMTEQVNWVPAILFYLLFCLGLVILVIKPALQKKSLKDAVLKGALLGLVTYATYDLTNLATLKNWPVLVTMVDLVWGTILSSLVSGATFLISIRVWKLKVI